MPVSLTKLWKKYGFEITVGVSVLLMVILYLVRKVTGKKGSWSNRIILGENLELNFDRKRTGVINQKTNLGSTSSTSSSPSSSSPSSSRGETECRKVLETLYQKPFKKARPDFLRNPALGTNNLELDCYNPELKIAVEYNGSQHYKYNPFFHTSKEAFQNQIYRDYLKRDMCVKNGIFLIEVPYTVKIPDIESFILQKLNE